MDKRSFAIDKDPITSLSIYNKGPQLPRAYASMRARLTTLEILSLRVMVVTNKHSYPGRDTSLC